MAAAVGFLVSLFVIAQSSGIGLLVVASILLIFMMLFPTILTEKDGLNWAQVGTVLVSAALFMADLFWPFPRQPAEPTVLQTTIIFLSILIVVFTVVLVRRFPAFTLRGKLISTTLVVTTLAIVSVAFGVNSFTRVALTEEGGKQLQALSHSQGILIGELLSRELTSLEALALDTNLIEAIQAQNASYTGSEEEILESILDKDEAWVVAGPNHPFVTAVLRNPVAEKMREFSAVFPENGNILITDQYGALIASTNRTERYFLAEEEWWENAYNIGFGKTSFSEPAINPRSGIGFFQIALPIFSTQANGTKKLIGVLHSNYSLKSLEDILIAAQIGETQAIKLHVIGSELALDEKNRLQINRDNIVAEAVLTEVQSSEKGYTFINFDGVSNLFSVANINTLNHQPIVDELGWFVSVQQAEEEALAPVAEQQRINTLLGIFVLLAAGAVAAYTGTKLTEPILQLTSVAKEVSAGNLDVRAEIDTQDEIGTLATVFNSMTAQVSDSIQTLERRVADRTRAQDTMIQVSRQLSTILDRQELVQAVVRQVRDAFDYYHAQIYLFDSEAQNLIMVGGTGEAGRQMLKNGHYIPAGKGLVGRAGEIQQPVLVTDTTQAADWLPNALLPETKAEVAVPIISGNAVWGVLDVQHSIIDGLSQTDVNLLESIANQVAVALRNANLYEEAQEQAKREALMNEINQKILSTKDVHEAMQVAVREIGRALDASQTVVRFAAQDAQPTSGQVAKETAVNGSNGSQKNS
ncbi:MAG: GAF domain-containing protein [Ardenticatenaceae bacterium]|nr:GAF domain-containing protein [Anaerolineales bacterium]MCB9008942.1 GAF domain-containing protein [Ardenticatenaceae bacterium]